MERKEEPREGSREGRGEKGEGKRQAGEGRREQKLDRGAKSKESFSVFLLPIRDIR